MTTLRLFFAESELKATPDTEVEWRSLNGSQQLAGRSALKALPAASRIEVFLPPARVLRTSVALPRGAARQAGKLLPFALDQVLLEDVSEQHLAHRLAGEQCYVAAIQRSTLAELLNILTQLGRRPRAVWAADMLLSNDGQSLLWHGNGWARREGATAQWFDAASPAEPPALLTATLQAAGPLTLAIAPTQASQPDLARWQTLLGVPVSVLPGDPLCDPLADDAIDLLQGEFAAGPQFDLDWSRLKPTGLLVGAAAGLLLLSLLGQWLSGRQEERALKQAMNAAFSQAFPGTPVVDAQLQLQAKLRSGTPVDAGALAPLLKAAPLLQGGEARLVTLDFQPGQLQAEYQASPEQLANLAQALSAIGKVETSPGGPNRTRLSVSLKP